MQTILLGAVSIGLGGCIIKSVEREALAAALKLDESLEILYVVALGKPNEKVVLDELPMNRSTRYWRDSHGIHHVPKRSIKELILNDEKSF